jgi:hypothetical protein
MSPQHDGVIANASGAAVRQDLNNALQALLSNSSGATAPATTYSFQFWADTTAGQLKQRNSANDAWIVVAELDGIEENLVLRNKTAEDFDNGRESIVAFEGTQSGGEVSTLANIEANHSGTADDEKGRLVFKTNNGSTLTTALSIDDQQKATFSLAPSVELELNSNNSRAIIDFNTPTGIGSIATQELIGSASGFGFNVSAGGSAPSEVLSLASSHSKFSSSVSGTMRTETEVTTTSGTVVNFDNLPYWAKRISVVGYGVSCVGTNDNLCFRLKTSNGAIATGYRSSSAAAYFTGVATNTLPAKATTVFQYGFGIASTVRDFVHTFTSMNQTPSSGLGPPGTSTVWVATGTMGAQYNAGAAYGVITQGGVVDATGTVTGVQVFFSLGSAFDAGKITVICEG